MLNILSQVAQQEKERQEAIARGEPDPELKRKRYNTSFHLHRKMIIIESSTTISGENLQSWQMGPAVRRRRKRKRRRERRRKERKRNG